MGQLAGIFYLAVFTAGDHFGHLSFPLQDKATPVRARGRCFKNLSQSLLGSLNQSCKASLIMDSHLAQHLAVQLDTSLLQTIHKARVVHTQRANCIVDAGDPQIAILALLQLTANESVVAALHDLLFCHLEMARFAAIVALSQLQGLLSAFASHHRAFDTSHFYISFTVTKLN
ncbi:hypothetical protein EVA_06934 [gut metagenome]|uniref:Uncharacterized protein n=1 Tax=gut metagenome TaxID=749906 RepID=J9GC85_9ZZZZ